MIKAEVISHEGNPGPNWLDHFRTLATPVNITVVLVLVAAGALFVGFTRNNKVTTTNSLPATSNSQQSTQPPVNALQVQPLSQETTTTNGNTSVQSAAGGNTPASNPNAQDSSSAVLGAAKTPALNSSSKSNSSKTQSPINYNWLNRKSLTNKARATAENINKTINGLTRNLGQ